MAQSYFGNQKFNDGQAALAQANRARMLNQTGRFSIPEMPRGSGITDPRQLELMRAQQNMRGVSDNRQTAYIPSDMERAAAMMSQGGQATEMQPGLTQNQQELYRLAGERSGYSQPVQNPSPQQMVSDARWNMDPMAPSSNERDQFNKLRNMSQGNSYFNVDAYR